MELGDSKLSEVPGRTQGFVINNAGHMITRCSPATLLQLLVCYDA
jgi:hypothetical protein